VKLKENTYGSKKKSLQFLVCISLIISIAIIFVYYPDIQDKEPQQATGTSRALSKPFHDIKGFHFSRNESGQRMFVLQADRFRVQKKKLGMIRFGLMKEVVVDNAKIDIYKIQNQELNLLSIAGPETLAEFKTKSTGKIIFSPVLLRVMSQDGQGLTKISAGSAIFDLKSRQVVFHQDVEIQSGDRTLHAGSLSILSTEGRAMAAEGVVLTSPDGTIRSDTLLTDIFLTPSTLNEKGI